MLQMSHEVGGVISRRIHYYSTSHSNAGAACSVICTVEYNMHHAWGMLPRMLCACAKLRHPVATLSSCKCTHCRWCICAVCWSILWLHAPVSCRECWSHIARRRELLKNDLRSHAAHEAW